MRNLFGGRRTHVAGWGQSIGFSLVNNELWMRQRAI